MRALVLIALLTVSAGANAKPAHVLCHAGKAVTYPVRHPQKVAHGLWKLMTAVF